MKNYAYAVVAGGWHRCHVLDMDNLARIGASRGMTQSQIAAAVGANQATISKIEKGTGNPTLDMIHRIATALGVHPSQLFTQDALHQRVISAIDKLDDDAAEEAAAIVLETMAGVRPAS